MEKPQRDEITFATFRKFFQSLVEGEKRVDDLTSYFDTKASILEEILFHYAGEYDKVISEANGNNQNKSEVSTEPFLINNRTVSDEIKHPTSTHIFDDKEALIELFKEFLQDDCEPPSGNLTGMQIHLEALWGFYGFIRPAEITLNLLLKLDVATLKIVQIAAAAASMMPPASQKMRRIQKVRKSKAEQFKQTSNEILEAYNDLEAQYLPGDGKKPFLVDGEQCSMNRLATKHMIMVQGVDLDPKQIVFHLKELIKHGSL